MRLITRSDFDGLVCAVLLKNAGIIESYKFVHPKDVQDGKIEATENDIAANIPYIPGCGLWFDHHMSEDERLKFNCDFKGESRWAKSCARVIYDYYGGAAKFPGIEAMMIAVDKTDSGDLTVDEVLTPQGWLLLSFMMDPRTGLGRYKDYRISNYQLMEELIEMCRTMQIEEILANPDVKERITRYNEQEAVYKQMIQQNSRVEGKVLIIDLRNVEEIATGNRFVEYSLYPDVLTSVRIMWGLNQQNTVFAVGHSIINRGSKINIGSLMLKNGGGGHFQVGTCQVENDNVQKALQDVLDKLNS
ncbi:MAG: exopolyphosphatase [Trichlorobacter sp.]|uniref:exopolyphosphatase n=1 Tax=Trichlorobacter sp. TaxID=2911007 RepID=UPI00256D0273|nr:exopolyphosphatase [Trichlorobacter sp.]MDK9717064.1 exopolyphosphatase [Trichlorobacter sp.]